MQRIEENAGYNTRRGGKNFVTSVDSGDEGLRGSFCCIKRDGWRTITPGDELAETGSRCLVARDLL